MKRFLIFAALVAAIACSKQEDFATLSFGLKGVEEHSMTRASADDVRSLISGRMPETIDLTLTRTKSGKTYSVTTGESITLPVGEYTVKANVKPSNLTNFPRAGMSAMDTPSLSINEKVTVVSGTDSYTLTPVFNCFAIAAPEDVASYSYAHGSASGTVSGDGIKLRFFGWDNDYELTVTAKPADYDSKDDAVFVFGGTGVQAQNGKFYILHPEAVITEESGFTFGLGAWTEGVL